MTHEWRGLGLHQQGHLGLRFPGGDLRSKWFTLAMGPALLLSLIGIEEPVKIAVYVEADREALESSGPPSQTSRAKEKDILDSAGDLRRQIEKRQNLVLAAHPEAADIVVTVMGRRIEITQNRPTDYGGGNTQSHYQSRHIISYRIEAGNSSHQSEYSAAGSLVTWTRVATGLSKHIEKWAMENLEQLLQYRERD